MSAPTRADVCFSADFSSVQNEESVLLSDET